MPTEDGPQPRIPSEPPGLPAVEGERITRRHLPHWQLPGACYFLTWRCRPRRTLDEAERDIVLQAVRHWDGRRWLVFAAVVMPNHVHVLAEPLANGMGVWDLGTILHSVKSFSAHAINRRCGQPGTIWQDERYDRWVRHEDELCEKWQYIRDNPVRAGLAAMAEEYRWLYERKV